MFGVYYVYRVSGPLPGNSIRFFDSEQVIGSSFSYGKGAFARQCVILEHIKVVEAVFVDSPDSSYRPSVYRTLWRPDWFSEFMPVDHVSAVQRLSELGLNEYAMDLIRQAKDAGFIAPELAPVLRL